MSAPSPKKKAAKRTPQERAEQNQDAFDNLRARAHKAGVRATGSAVTVEPYVIAAANLEDGNDDDVVFTVPTSLTERVELTRMISYVNRLQISKQAAEAMAVIPDILIAYSSPQTLVRLLHAFDRLDDADELLFGLAINVIEHFAGSGAVDVPGGSNAS